MAGERENGVLVFDVLLWESKGKEESGRGQWWDVREVRKKTKKRRWAKNKNGNEDDDIMLSPLTLKTATIKHQSSLFVKIWSFFLEQKTAASHLLQ